MLTDGAEWAAYHLRNGGLVKVASLQVAPSQPDVDALLVWLEGVLATAQGLRPTPAEITRRLGADSPSHALDRQTLTGLYATHGQLPSVQLKRRLWARLLTTALGAQFEDSDELFLEHTLLVNSAEVIAHAVVGFDVATLPPPSLLGGRQFELAQIAGVVEADFFDWVLEVPDGASFVRALARRLARFDWGAVDHDVLKVLYESVIGTQTRRKLGEYYTPDWLAEQMVTTVVTEPLEQRVLDPACGSGTFLFHAVRRFLATAEATGVPLAEMLERVSAHVLGVDLHPVAVALARVTYLLAIGRQRLTDPRRGPVSVPVYLGDSVQWQQRLDLLTADHLVVPTDDQAQLFASELRFPDHLLADAARFDRLVTELADAASKPTYGTAATRLGPVFRRLAIPPGDQPTITATFELLCELHEQGRDHIWGYYVRNLARPLWLCRLENRVDVLVGNPPWLAYRHMTADMQQAFRAMCTSRDLWHGKSVATQQDLSALFVARAVQLYLRHGGRFAFVLPNAALDRRQFDGFRAGTWPDPVEPAAVSFDLPWDLRRLRPHFFPRAAAVVFGHRTHPEHAAGLPTTAQRWTGRLGRVDSAWRDVRDGITRTVASLEPGGGDAESPYQARFANGANVFPRVLFLVDDQPASPLGLAAGGRAVRSARSANEKLPWKQLAALDGVVEDDFVRRIYLGENVLPYRLLPPERCVVPFDGTQLMSGDSARLDHYPRLAQWWRHAERLWLEHRSSDRFTLLAQLDYRHKFSDQFPAPPQRVVYAASGMHLAAVRVTDPTAVIEHSLYWGAAASDDEALYLCAILNSPTITELVRPLMAYGKDERHIDKAVWRLPIPLYDPDHPLHQQLSQLGQHAEDQVAALELDESEHFPALRRKIRTQLAGSPPGCEIDRLVEQLLPNHPATD